MIPPGKHVVFDVVGTCVSYDSFFEGIESRLGDKLKAKGIKPKLLGYAWMEASEREYSYLGLSGRYVPFWTVFEPLFYRMLWMAGIEEPREFATDEDVKFIINSYRQLKARPGIGECFEKLRASGFTIWALTSGDTDRVWSYLSQNGIEIPAENFVSCDSLGVGKPAPASYEHLLSQFSSGQEVWFAAAHMWDSAAAKRNGYVMVGQRWNVSNNRWLSGTANTFCSFKAAWCSIWEKEPCIDVFGEVDVMADSLVEMADKIIAGT